jgi:hypothetical protein
MRVAWIAITSMLVGTLVGCAPTFVLQKREDGPQASTSSSEQGVPRTTSAVEPASGSTEGGEEHDDGPSLTVTYPLPPDVARVQILTTKHPTRSAEVLAVFDFHTDADSEDKGFDQLRLAAARVGADAVIGAEFEHGEDGGKSHLSGMAVRFLDH